MTEQTANDKEGFSVSLNLPPEVMMNRVEAVAPVSPDLIRGWFTNKDLWFVINYSQGKLKGAQFLTYLTNLGIPCDIKFDTPTPFPDYEEIMLAFMKQNSVCNIAGLNVMAGQMLLWAKGLDYAAIPYDLPIPVDYLGNFIGRNKELVDKWISFLDSSQIFAIKAIERLNAHYKPAEVFEVIEDRTYVGTNVATMFGLPEFMGLYSAMPPGKMFYFKHQFEDYMFKGAHLAHYFSHRNCVPAVLLTHFARGTIKAGDVDSVIFKSGVFGPEFNFKEYDPNAKPETIQDGQPVVGETGASDPVPSQPEPGAA